MSAIAVPVPLNCAGQWRVLPQPAALLILSDPEALSEQTRLRLQARYDLTPWKPRWLRTCWIAAERSRSINTVRPLIARVM